MESPELSSTFFPRQTPDYILSFQFSSWYPDFAHLSIKSTIIRPLSGEFHEYLDADGVFVPEGSEDVPAESHLSDNDDSDDDEDEPRKHYSFPELDSQIREAIQTYGAVFPKLNFSSPRDAAWILPPSSPLKCTSPADVYLLLKSSDFVTHDLSVDNVFAGCEDGFGSTVKYSLELVLRKWYPIDRSRELRCFVRGNRLIGITQRDTNFYEFLNELSSREKIILTTLKFWEDNIKGKSLWKDTQDYVFDFLLTRDLSRGHIIDFNPYAPRTDTLLFTFDELHSHFEKAQGAPVFKVIDSLSHPIVTRNAPAHQHNMVPFEALSLSNGRNIEDFANLWKESVQESTPGGSH
ncbi:D123-domain-containing protein [Pluteus cervinus]|uniref:D123-domain-containing protein n=1 Tax=Pluteus cervinus TaxID=181527 RepID=A0ACD3B7D4_9AGAR|nr:D123-domain-containing protein [Pluteus cervinus]